MTSGELGGSPLVILWKAGQSSALDDQAIAAGRDVGTVGVFPPILDGQTVTKREPHGTCTAMLSMVPQTTIEAGVVEGLPLVTARYLASAR